MKLQGRNIILTGASRGFGKYLAGRLWEEGANLILSMRSLSPTGLPPREGQSFVVIIGDLLWFNTLQDLMAPRYEMGSHIDGLVNNAAMQGPVGPAWENERVEVWDTLIVDMLSPMDLCRLVVPEMLKQGHGKIVNLSGGGATNPRPNYSAYATAKAGLVRFSETLAAELKGTGIDVNCVAPGKMPTGMLPAGETADENSMEKAANLIIWLLSDDSNEITGKLISAIHDEWENPIFRGLLWLIPELCTLRRIDEATAYGQTLERIEKARSES